MILHNRRFGYLAAAILLLYGLLTIGYALATPVFEAPDENHHFYTVQAIAANGRLPIAGNDTVEDNLARQEAAQPPLYYVLLALMLGRAGEAPNLQINPYAQLGQTTGNPNLYVHEGGEKAIGDTAVLRLRLFSLILGGLTLVVIYRAGRLLWPLQPGRAVLAMSLVAFLPQFNFLHAVISNDTLMILLSSLVIWQVLRLWLTGITGKRLLLLGVTLGAAMLTKTAGLLLLVWVVAVSGWWWWRVGRRQHGRTPFIRDFILLTLLPAILIASWWFWRNWALYGDITAANVFIKLAGGERSLTFRQLLRELITVAQSAVAYFGWMTVQPPSFVYWLWAGLGLLALVGMVTAVRRQTLRWDLVVILAGWVLLLVAGWLQFMLKTPAEQGRLLFPALLPIALALAYGLSQFRYGWLAGIVAFATSCYALLVIIPATYAPPPLITAANLPPTAHVIQTPLGALELVAVEPLPDTAVPGDWVEMTLYWQKKGEVTQPPTEVITILGHDLALVGSRHTYHGNGLFPATFWPDEQIIVDRVSVYLEPTMTVPTEVRLFVSVLDTAEQVEIGRIKVIPAQWPTANTPALAQWGDGIWLTDAQVLTTTETLEIQLQWHVTQPPLTELTTFIHWGDPAAPPLAQADGPARQGFYPTRLWAAGEVFTDTYTVLLPEGMGNGRYPLHIGFYDPATGQRLPLTINGQHQPNDAYWLGEFDATIR